MCVSFPVRVYPQNKPDRPGSYPSHTVRPVHDRLGVRHPNKTLNKMVVEHTSEDKNEKVNLPTSGFPVLAVCPGGVIIFHLCNRLFTVQSDLFLAVFCEVSYKTRYALGFEMGKLDLELRQLIC